MHRARPRPQPIKHRLVLLSTHSRYRRSRHCILQEAETEREQMLGSNNTSLPGLLRHVANKEDARRLNTLWAKAFHHAGLPPNAVEDDYIRDAIFQTSKSQVSRAQLAHTACFPSVALAATQPVLLPALCLRSSSLSSD